ncbi:uncharacterized protein LOC124373311 [Homalodisca vitripennis]|uniref:uncharacterized protein LOC124373311 n=1 Tax=Homalodisca vitripennis TaxID=197043 RepID=UPI001EEC5A88|nr:uncharacterized protein LOC124373311 [Homalodisca vitripennis]
MLSSPELEHNEYLSHVEEVAGTNPKILWSFFQEFTETEPCVLHSEVGSSCYFRPKRICVKFFSSFFSPRMPPVFATPTDPLSLLEGPNNHSISSCQITAKEVQQVLSCLDPNKDCGPDNIPPSMLKHSRFLISEPLAILINMSLCTGTFPDALKLDHVVPIYKCGSKEDV